eukprot:CAMPEP_0201521374 /NCGR_PEP_ID=MMETSP0161_2-20130828/14380_1 /ASSEMBLY_ACC=CAM_ASM_000251 /TAXON_ID=180227 /ORGANISM="Neoparamoeba aestuarina, Strain SoJaBio B1-5/56/2" /LENGTH=199 /DNA_ID=CAMNT_0047920005 /DNA_START=78 /DNA_END=677 /DNA_ORIENTATION=-
MGNRQGKKAGGEPEVADGPRVETAQERHERWQANKVQWEALHEERIKRLDPALSTSLRTTSDPLNPRTQVNFTNTLAFKPLIPNEGRVSWSFRPSYGGFDLVVAPVRLLPGKISTSKGTRDPDVYLLADSKLAGVDLEVVADGDTIDVCARGCEKIFSSTQLKGKDESMAFCVVGHGQQMIHLFEIMVVGSLVKRARKA